MWGYGTPKQPATYPSRTIIAETGREVRVNWLNELKNAQGNLPHLLPVDTSIHWADPQNPPYPASGVPIVTHLHGGQTEFMSDGHPDAWFTPDFEQRGPEIARAVYVYDNEQEATTLWYHDHALGITRLNVYAGLAGFYLIRDEHEKKLIKKHKLPGAPYEIPVVIQDKMFTANGALHYPTGPQNSILPEFFGDFIIVNGKAWPKLDVEPRKYRFRLLNGSDSRFYRLTLRKELSPNTPENRIPFCQIGTDQGFLNSPVELDELVLAPAERADIIVDFSCLKNQNLIFYNDARSPFPDGDLLADPESTALIFKMRVVKPLSSNDDCP
jgi:spore coat protein A